MRNPYLQIETLQQALASDKNKVGFLLGAGCPVSIRVSDQPLIPNIEGLTSLICKKLAKEKIEKIVERISSQPNKKATIEDILTHIRLLIEVVGTGKIGEFNQKTLEDLERKICETISEEVNKELPNEETPYHKLASWICGIPRSSSVEIFTPNYDLLMESALEAKLIPYFDGFIGSKKAFFDLHAIEHETLPARWVKLWKLHGSTNWWNDSKHNVFRGTSDSPQNKHMIYPSHLKYDQSRRMPYLAMQDRLSVFLATGQAIVVTCGYSFADQHLNSILMQRLLANPRAICFGLLFDNLDTYPEALECAKKTTNISLLAKDGAFIGGRKWTWGKGELNTHNYYDFCIEKNADTNGDDSVIECKIGDFQVFGDFLLNQLAPQKKLLEDVENAS